MWYIYFIKKVSILTKLPDRQFESLRKIQGYTLIFSELSKNIGTPDILLIDAEYPKDKLKNIPFNTWSCYFPIEKLKNNVIDKNLPALYETLTKDQTIFTKHYDFVHETFLPTEYGNFIMFGFRGRTNGKTILGLRTETLPDIVSVRTHSMCYTGDIFHSLKCDCREELEHALEYIQEKQGIFIYALEEGRGIGVLNKLAVYIGCI